MSEATRPPLNAIHEQVAREASETVSRYIRGELSPEAERDKREYARDMLALFMQREDEDVKLERIESDE